MTACHSRQLVRIWLQGFDEEVLGCASKTALVLHLPDPRLLHVGWAQHSSLHNIRHSVVNELPEQIAPPAVYSLAVINTSALAVHCCLDETA